MNMQDTEIYRPEDHEQSRKELCLWFCGGCEAVHLTAGGFRLSFTQDEYAAFTRMAVETYYAGWPASGFDIASHGIDESGQIAVSTEAVH